MIEDENIVEDEELAGTMDQVRCSQADSQSFVNYWTGRMKNSDIKIIIEPPLVEQSIIKKIGRAPVFCRENGYDEATGERLYEDSC